MFALGPKDGKKIAVETQDVGLVLDPRGPVRLVHTLPVRNDVVGQLNWRLVEEHEVDLVDIYAGVGRVGKTRPAGRRIVEARICDEHAHVEIAERTSFSRDLRAEHVSQPYGRLL